MILLKIKPYKGRYVTRKKANTVNDMFASTPKPDRTALYKEAEEFIEIIRQKRAYNIKSRA